MLSHSALAVDLSTIEEDPTRVAALMAANRCDEREVDAGTFVYTFSGKAAGIYYASSASTSLNLYCMLASGSTGKLIWYGSGVDALGTDVNVSVSSGYEEVSFSDASNGGIVAINPPELNSIDIAEFKNVAALQFTVIRD
jgi:hypothetical protein